MAVSSLPWEEVSPFGLGSPSVLFLSWWVLIIIFWNTNLDTNLILNNYWENTIFMSRFTSTKKILGQKKSLFSHYICISLFGKYTLQLKIVVLRNYCFDTYDKYCSFCQFNCDHRI